MGGKPVLQINFVHFVSSKAQRPFNVAQVRQEVPKHVLGMRRANAR
jgi:hypothetical protein